MELSFSFDQHSFYAQPPSVSSYSGYLESAPVIVGGLVITNLEFEVPLDYNKPQGDKITVFVRKLVATGKEHANLPYMLYLQGGPGCGSPRPEGRFGWIKRATEEYQLLLLDQRGCGLSSPITHQTLLSISENPEEQAAYLSLFRADNIIKDCEFIREKLLGKGTWSVLGQSYGGFCLMHYLSVAPSGLKAALFAGGLPSVVHNNPDDIYRFTYKKVLEHNKMYYATFPQDVQKIRTIVNYLRTHQVTLPSGGQLTARRFLQIGIGLGLGQFERIHYVIENAWVTTKHKLPNGSIEFVQELSLSFLRNVETMMMFDLNPLYAVLHESIYCQGQASNWSAQRILKEFQEFDNDGIYKTGDTPVDSPITVTNQNMMSLSNSPSPAVPHSNSIYIPQQRNNHSYDSFPAFGYSTPSSIPASPRDGEPYLFTGEMIFDWMFDDYQYLQVFKQVSHILARKSDWPKLYNLDVLAKNEVPCAAIVYYDDMYVPRELSEDTGKRVRNLKLWHTNEYNHSGLNLGGELIVSRLLQLVHGVINS